jgi:hypothetical protein
MGEHRSQAIAASCTSQRQRRVAGGVAPPRRSQVGSRSGAVTADGSVSTPRHLEPDVGNYPIRLSCSFHVKAFVSYRAGSAFGQTPRC